MAPPGRGAEPSQGHWLDRIVVLLEADTADLRQLAVIAGYDPARFYAGTSLEGCDLRGQDLTGMAYLPDAAEPEPEPDPGPPPEGFDLAEAHRMILAGRAPPDDWVPYVTRLDFAPEAAAVRQARSPLRSISTFLGLTSEPAAAEPAAVAKLGDLTPLAGLRFLHALRLRETDVVDLAPLAGLSRLRELDLARTKIADIGVLRQLRRLETLDLGSDEQIADLAPVAACRGLRVLSLNHLDLRRTQALAALRALRTLSLYFCRNVDFATLSNCAALTSLTLTGTRPGDIGFLRPLRQLTDLQLSYCQVADLSPLEGMDGLTDLNLDNNPLSDISVVAGFAALQTISVLRTQVDDFTPLAGLTRLRRIYVEDSAQKKAVLRAVPSAGSIAHIIPSAVTRSRIGRVKAAIASRFGGG